MKILVVDDFITNVSMMRATLAKAGHFVTTARDGAQALDVLQQHPVDMVITDWMMPTMDGVELVRRIRTSAKPHPLLIMVTSLDSRDARRIAIGAGVDAYLAKPVDPRELLETVTGLERSSGERPATKLPTGPTYERTTLPNIHGVALAAGTGGALSLQTIVRGLSRSDPAAYFAVVHGPGWATEAIADLIGSATDLAICLPTTTMPIRPGTLFLAPGDRHLLLAPGGDRIELSSTPRENHLRPAADPLMRSLAAAFGPMAVGIILGGTSADGTVGAGYIRTARGITIVQDPAEAEAPLMPENIIQRGMADQVLPLDRIAPAIRKAIRGVPTIRQEVTL